MIVLCRNSFCVFGSIIYNIKRITMSFVVGNWDMHIHGRVTSCQLLKELSRYLFLAVVSILFKENYMDNDC